MNDRGIIKWQPFDSVFSSTRLKKEVASRRNIITKPILSDDQKLIIENNLLEAYHENILINITLFKNNQIFKISKRILKIIFVNKKIIFDDYSYIFFDQIISTSI